jgi:hypothetical protein
MPFKQPIFNSEKPGDFYQKCNQEKFAVKAANFLSLLLIRNSKKMKF